jgi:5'-deoxynucleotidase YfbR-like HD superfamily hydrolase
MENLYAGRLIRTFKGHYFDVFDPNPEQIEIEDIAHSLSLLCRFAGHIRSFHSVAEHSIWVSRNVSAESSLSALLHDASEAYLIDLPSPIKKEMPEYLNIENNLMIAISKKLGFQFPFNEEVKKADKMALEYEWENKVLKDNHVSFNSDEAKKFFLEEYYKIKRLQNA